KLAASPKIDNISLDEFAKALKSVLARI
ncbi:hypothetical protein, partial [Escherichia coli]